MKTRLIFLLIVSYLTFIYSCDRELINSGFPAIILTSASNGNESLVLSGEFLRNSPADSNEAGFIWQAGEDPLLLPGFRIKAEKDGPDRFGALVSSSIKKDLEYYIRAFVRYGDKVVYSEILRYQAEIDLPCVLNGFDPVEGYGGDTVSIHGNGFNLTVSYNRVYFDNVPAFIFAGTDTTLTCRVPAGSEAGLRSVRVVVNGVEGSFTDKYNLLVLPDPQISSVSGTSIKYCDTLTVYGANFDLVDEVILGGSGGTIKVIPFLITPDSIKIVIYDHQNPYQILGYSNFRIGVTRDNTTVWSGWISIVSSWSRLADFPSNSRYKAGCFSINGKIYMGCGAAGSTFNDFWKFDPVTGSWTRMADLPGAPRIYPISFGGLNYGYMGCGNSEDNSSKIQLYDFYKYNPETNIWNALPDYPDNIADFFVGYFTSVNGRPFAGLSNTTVIMRELVNDAWTSRTGISDLMDNTGTGMFAIGDSFYVIAGFNLDGSSSREVWEYNTTTGLWTKKANFPGPTRHVPINFSIGSYGYYGCGRGWDANNQYKDMWRYNPKNDKWIRIEDFPGGYRSHMVSTSNGNAGYAGLGIYMPTTTYFNDFWKYNPE